jgi:CheY-like chemotaxis protein
VNETPHPDRPPPAPDRPPEETEAAPPTPAPPPVPEGGEAPPPAATAGEPPSPAAAETELPGPEERGNLFDAATAEADRHKWIESEKAGHDLGVHALRDWHRNYWRSWCRERWIEHLHGEKFWAELDQGDYGMLRRRFQDNPGLASAIVEKIKSGGENLDIIQWATEQNFDVEAVIDVLKSLDINSRRLAAPEEWLFEEPEEPEESDETGTSTRRRVLVVDDDEDTCQLLQELFEMEGLECVTVGSGEEAISRVQQRRFHCYLIDIMLPGKHGAEVAWYLRRHGITAPVVAISAVLERWNEDDLYDCGFTGILSKPFDLPQLRELAREVKEG